MEKIKEIFKKYSVIYFTIFLILIIVGVTLATFSFTKASNENILSLGQISMSYEEPSNAYVVDDALPMKDEVGMKTGEYFEFKVMTHATTNANDNTGLEIPYEINLGDLAIDIGMTKLTKEQVKVYLTKVVNGVETEVIRPRKLSSFTTTDNGNAILYKTYDTHKNAGSSITTTYRLRAWVNYDMDINLFNGTTQYQYKFNVNINAKTNILVEKGTLASTWKDYTSNENNYLAIYTLDKKEMPSTYTYNNVTYTKTSEIDISSDQKDKVILGEYKDTSGNIIALIGQDGGVVAPTDSTNLFASLTKLTNLYLSNLNTKNVTNMDQMFYNLSKLTTLDISNFDTRKVTNMHFMFNGCSALTSLDVTSFMEQVVLLV